MKNKQVQYTYCIDEKEQLVHINSISKENRHAHQLRCLGCGQKMIPNLGDVKAWHFSHKAGTACNGESYLHKLAKRRIREKFETSDSFPITFIRDVPCKEKDTCPCFEENYCKKNDVPIRMDLKTWKGRQIYNKCTAEGPVRIFRADLLLTYEKKSERKPVAIEVYVTHEVEENKKNEGFRIIETKQIKSEDDIDDIINRGFIEGENCKTYGFDSNRFPNRKNNVLIKRFILYKSNAAFVSIISCDKIEQRCRQTSLRELNFREEIIPNNKLNSHQIGLVYLVKNGMNIRNCMLCRYYRFNDFNNKFWELYTCWQ